MIVGKESVLNDTGKIFEEIENSSPEKRVLGIVYLNVNVFFNLLVDMLIKHMPNIYNVSY